MHLYQTHSTDKAEIYNLLQFQNESGVKSHDVVVFFDV